MNNKKYLNNNISTEKNNDKIRQIVDKGVIYTQGDYIEDSALAQSLSIVGTILDYLIKKGLTNNADYISIVEAYVILTSNATKRSKRIGGRFITLAGIHKFLNSDIEYQNQKISDRCQQILDELNLPKQIFTKYHITRDLGECDEHKPCEK